MRVMSYICTNNNIESVPSCNTLLREKECNRSCIFPVFHYNLLYYPSLTYHGFSSRNQGCIQQHPRGRRSSLPHQGPTGQRIEDDPQTRDGLQDPSHGRSGVRRCPSLTRSQDLLREEEKIGCINSLSILNHHTLCQNLSKKRRK